MTLTHGANEKISTLKQFRITDTLAINPATGIASYNHREHSTPNFSLRSKEFEPEIKWPNF